jgi:putative (di)nucleoside polyphosphate hydrolase
MTQQAYRPCVGIIVFNATGQVWLGQRLGESGPYNWQFPQGGIDAGEDPLAASRRELEDETGIRSVTLLGRTPDWIIYDFPPEVIQSGGARGFRGQKQLWFAYRFLGAETEINLAAHHPAEFETWRWVDIQEAIEAVVPFKRAVYEQVAKAFAPFTKG